MTPADQPVQPAPWMREAVAEILAWLQIRDYVLHSPSGETAPIMTAKEMETILAQLAPRSDVPVGALVEAQSQSYEQIPWVIQRLQAIIAEHAAACEHWGTPRPTPFEACCHEVVGIIQRHTASAPAAELGALVGRLEHALRPRDKCGDALLVTRQDLTDAIAKLHELTGEVERCKTPEVLHSHCLRYLTPLQIAHLFGEKHTENLNKLESDIARVTYQRDDARRTCDELTTDSNAVTLAQSLQRMEAERDALRYELAQCQKDRDAWKDAFERLQPVEGDLVVTNLERDGLRVQLAEARREVERLKGPWTELSPTTQFHEWMHSHGLESCTKGTTEQLATAQQQLREARDGERSMAEAIRVYDYLRACADVRPTFQNEATRNKAYLHMLELQQASDAAHQARLAAKGTTAGEATGGK